jgi:hypothetical protein
MARAIVMDEFHLTIYAPGGLPEAAYDAFRRALDDPMVRISLRKAIRNTFLSHPPLDAIRFSVTR